MATQNTNDDIVIEETLALGLGVKSGDMTATATRVPAYKLVFKFPFYNPFSFNMVIEEIAYVLHLFRDKKKYTGTVTKRILVKGHETVEVEIVVVVVEEEEIDMDTLYDLSLKITVVDLLGRRKLPRHFEGRITDLILPFTPTTI